MIWIYEQGFENFSTNGLGTLIPARCFITEEQGGSYELELEHPMDELGVFDLLKTGRVIKAPVPAQTTPFINIDASEGYEVWETTAEAKVYTKQSTSLGTTVTVDVPAEYDTTLVRPGVVHMQDAYTTTKWKPNGNRVLETVAIGVEVSVLLKDDTWYKVTTPSGNTGWVEASKIELVQTVPSVPPETIQSRKTRDQLFRIYRAEKDTNNKTVKVWARHISYDLLANVLIDCNLENVSITAAIVLLNANCTQADHGFNIYTDSTATITADYSRKGILEALLDPDEGIMALANLRMVRDNYDIFLLKRSATSRQPVTYGYNLLGVNVDISEDSIVNRIVPIGKTKDGEPLHIDEVYVDSPRNDETTLIRASVIEYDVEENDDVTLAQAKAALIDSAEADFEAGIDLPDIAVRVDFLQLGDTEEYIAYRDLDRLYLGDIVTVNDEVHGVVLDAEVTKIEYDPLTGSYVGMEVGVTDASRTIGSLGAFMLPNGSIRGYKLLPGSVDGSRLENLSVTSAKIGLAVIDTAHIKNAAITNALISDATIETAKIKDAQITNAKIADATIETAKIKDAQITNAKIADATIETAKIKDAQITNAKIANAGIDFLKVKNSVLDTAIFREIVAGGDVYIDRLRVAEANITSLTVGDLIIKDPDDGTLHRLYVDEGVVKTELVDILYQNLSEDALLKVSEWTVHKSETAPSAPYVNQLWIKPSTGIMQKCLTITPSVTWGDVKAGELHTSYIDAVTKGLNILTGGEMNILSGGKLTIKALGDAASIIDMDNTGMTISSTGKLKLLSASSIEIGGSPFNVGKRNYFAESKYAATQWTQTDLQIFTSESGFTMLAGHTYCVTMYARKTGEISYRLWGNGYDWSQLLNSGSNVGEELNTTIITPSVDVMNPYVMTADSNGTDYHIYDWAILEETTNPSMDWYHAETDPSDGVLTSHISIRNDLVVVSSGGKLQLDSADLEVISGTVDIDTDTFNVRNGPDDMLYLDADEMIVSAKLLSAPNIQGNVVNTWDGGDSYVYSGSMQATIDNLPKYLKADTNIYFPSTSPFYEDLLIEGFFGAKLTIVIGNNVFGHITVKNCSSVAIGGGYYAITGTAADRDVIYAENVGRFDITYLNIDAAPGASRYCLFMVYVKFQLTNVDMTGAIGIVARESLGYCVYCTGTLSAYGIVVEYGSHIGVATAVPSGATANTLTGAGTLVGTGTPTSSIRTPSTPPSYAAFLTFNSTAAGLMALVYRRTGTSSGSGAITWGSYSLNSYVDWAAGNPRQGTVTMAAVLTDQLGMAKTWRQDQYRYLGAWILPAVTSYGSATSAKLTVTRLSSGGSTGAQTVNIYWHEYTSLPTGHAYSLTDTGLDVSLDVGQSYAVWLDATTLAALVAGTLKGFGLSTADPSVHMTTSISLEVHY